MHKLWQDQAKVAQSHQVLVDSTFNIALEELVAKIPTPDPESTAMTSDELQSLFDSGITGVNDRSRSFGQPPTSVLNKMRENMAEEHSSNEQPDEEFLEDLRDDIAKWEIKDEVDESGEIPSDADITSQAGKPNDAMSPKNNVPVNAKKGSRLGLRQPIQRKSLQNCRTTHVLGQDGITVDVRQKILIQKLPEKVVPYDSSRRRTSQLDVVGDVCKTNVFVLGKHLCQIIDIRVLVLDNECADEVDQNNGRLPSRVETETDVGCHLVHSVTNQNDAVSGPCLCDTFFKWSCVEPLLRLPDLLECDARRHVDILILLGQLTSLLGSDVVASRGRLVELEINGEEVLFVRGHDELSAEPCRVGLVICSLDEVCGELFAMAVEAVKGSLEVFVLGLAFFCLFVDKVAGDAVDAVCADEDICVVCASVCARDFDTHGLGRYSCDFLVE
ncbi:hypothetical protein HG531_004546 [Fusarium graminearum]|nr:hypothetical protein HG531_004546 [Fusarium graminearum]